MTALVARLGDLEGVMRLGPFFQNRWWGFWGDGWGTGCPRDGLGLQVPATYFRRIRVAANLDFVDREVGDFLADFFGEGCGEVAFGG